MRITAPTTAIILTLTCLAGQVNASDAATTKTLIDALSSDRYPPPSELSSELKLAIELGEPAIPTLVRLLQAAKTDERAQRAATALAYVGGSSAVRVLQEKTTSTSAIWAKPLLCFSVPSAPSESLITFLVQSLDVPHIGDEWPAAQQAAFSLGLLREKVAIPALEREVKKDRIGGEITPTFAGQAAEEALGWIRRPSPKIVFQATSSNDDLMRALFETGIPASSRFSRLCESASSKRTWTKSADGWTVTAGCAPKSKAVRVTTESYRSTDGLRAVVAIGFYAGPLDGVGYNYVLRKRGNSWVVVGLEQTWVS